jgi:hypothetical protein
MIRLTLIPVQIQQANENQKENLVNARKKAKHQKSVQGK